MLEALEEPCNREALQRFSSIALELMRRNRFSIYDHLHERPSLCEISKKLKNLIEYLLQYYTYV